MNGYDSDDEYDRHPSISLLLNRKAELIAKQQQGTIIPREITELENIKNTLYAQKGGGGIVKSEEQKRKNALKKERGLKRGDVNSVCYLIKDYLLDC